MESTYCPGVMIIIWWSPMLWKILRYLWLFYVFPFSDSYRVILLMFMSSRSEALVNNVTYYQLMLCSVLLRCIYHPIHICDIKSLIWWAALSTLGQHKTIEIYLLQISMQTFAISLRKNLVPAGEHYSILVKLIQHILNFSMCTQKKKFHFLIG